MTARLARPLSRLSRLFSRWPVRWRLAVASAGLTLVILVGFAAVVGRLATDQMRNDFHEELGNSAQRLADDTTLGLSAGQTVVNTRHSLAAVALANGAVVRVVDQVGNTIAPTDRNVDLGAPQNGYPEVDGMHVATAAIESSGFPVFIQYARSSDDMDASISRVWLFLLAGVLGGTVLATLAGLAVADRAMRPIADLTATAREITATRDTSKGIPEPKTEDEVAELANTLAEMLASLDSARTEREEALSRQREFLADASHELRTPLTSILANLELLEEELDGDSDQAEMVGSALNSSRRMRRLVSDLLLLARADAGRVSPHSSVDLSEIAAAAAAEVRPMSDGHLLSVDLPDSMPVEANPDELHRVVVNLLDNSVRHTPRGTRIELGGSVRTDSGEIELSVSDDGPGFPEGMESQVFDRFVRGEGPADTASDAGTGLGLAIVRAVAQAHGGSVEAGRSPAGGARLVVRLPLSKGTAAPSESAQRLAIP